MAPNPIEEIQNLSLVPRESKMRGPPQAAFGLQAPPQRLVGVELIHKLLKGSLPPR